MNQDFFITQMARLRDRFGEKAFGAEFTKLIAGEVKDMTMQEFKTVVDAFIGSRRHTNPPVLTDFREARLAREKRKFEDDLRGAQRFMDKRAPAEMKAHARSILSKEFGHVESVTEALEIARLKIRMGEK